MTVKEDLQAARDLIVAPTRWIQNVSAIDAHGQQVRATNPQAVCVCLLGAIERMTKADPIRYIACYAALGGTMFLAHFNDTHTHQEVLALLDQTISEMSS